MVSEVGGLAPTRPGVATRRAGVVHGTKRLWRSGPIRVIRRRLLVAIPLLVVVSALSFLLVSLTPGSLLRELLGLRASPQQYATLRRQLGLGQPLYEQYWHWATRAVTGDLGASLFSGEPVTHAINSRLPVTLSLLLGALLVSVVIGVTLGVVSAVRGGFLGRVVDVVALVGFALPGFWVGAELIALFAVKLRLLPATGYVPFTESVSGWLRSLVLPVAALALGGVAAIAKQTREAMLDALGSEYIRMAWANGIPPRAIFFRHALKNASLPVLAVVGVQAVGLLGGAILAESVFALPGVGSLVVNAALEHDIPLVQGVAIYFTVIVIVINIVIDVSYSLLDPRVRVG